MDEINSLLSDAGVMRHVWAVILGSVRLISFVGFAPFFGATTNAAIALPLVMALYIPLHFYLVDIVVVPDVSTWMGLLEFVVLVLKEGFIGFVLAFLCMTVFWAIVSGGTIIDNQRGASMAQGSDPLGGAEASPLGTILFLAMVVLFFVSGAFMHFVNMLYSTYAVWSPFELLPALINSNLSVFALQQLDNLMLHAILLCAPFLLVTLMSDISLALVNRFAPQLNVFVLSMPVKSGICAFLIILYINQFLDYAYSLFGFLQRLLQQMQMILGQSM